MSSQLDMILADGMANGRGPREIARDMAKRVDGITKKRALVIARTEIIHAHAEGQLDSMETLGVSKTTAAVEFATAGDEKVCPRCAALEGKEYTIKQAHGVIPVHPNCRCAWIPLVATPSKEAAAEADKTLDEFLNPTKPVPTPKAVTKKPKAATTPKPKAATTPKPKAKPAVAGAFPPAPSAKEVLNTFTDEEITKYSMYKSRLKERSLTSSESSEMAALKERVWKLIEIPKEQRATALEEFMSPSAAFKKYPAGMNQLQTAFNALSRILPKDRIAAPVAIKTERKLRASYDPTTKALHCNKQAYAHKYMHEFMHFFEDHTKRGLLVTLFRDERNGDEEEVLLSKALKEPRYGDEVAVRDGWEQRGWHLYAAKVYPRERVHTELLSMGVERLYADPIGFAQQDPEFFNFFLKVVQRPVDELRD
jgi:SPP1 gp7 family putative phage head morphogenesis protein